MPRFSSKHGKAEKIFKFSGFSGGYDQDKSAEILSIDQLSECMNLKYGIERDDVILNVRPGSIKISNTALPGSADVLACTYYVSQSKYILATDTKLYYLDGSSDPVEIGSSFLDGIPTFTEFNGKLIIHDSGITKFWDGTTSPVENTNYGKITKYYMDEILATGDDVETEYTGTLSHPAVVAGSLSISFTDTSAKTITDGGSGRLTGNVDAAWVKTITGCADNGAGLIRVTVTAHGGINGDKINILSVAGTVEANNTLSNPTWTIVGKTDNTMDLTGSTFSNAYTSGGTVSKNTIIYSSGTYTLKADGAPDCSSITASYKKTDGAPKSKTGLVRSSRLYSLGDADNLSRLTYTEVNDETATDSSSGGGYLDVDPNDGHDLIGAINFFTTVLCFKQSSMHRIDSFPGEATFAVEKLTDDLGALSHRSVLFEGDIVSFIGNGGWFAMHPSQRFGDIQKEVPLSNNFGANATKYANSMAYSAYNAIDDQLWLSLSTDGSSTYLNYIYVINLNVRGLVSLYRFSFGHSCFCFSNSEMLIGGIDGNLYKLDDTDSVFTDNNVSYSADTYWRSSYTDWGFVNNDKHNKKIQIRATTEAASFTANLKLFRNGQYQAFDVHAVSSVPSYQKTNPGGIGLYVYDMKNMPIGTYVSEYTTKKRFNYKKIMYEMRDINISTQAYIRGVNFTSAVIGD